LNFSGSKRTKTSPANAFFQYVSLTIRLKRNLVRWGKNRNISWKKQQKGYFEKIKGSQPTDGMKISQLME